MGFTTSWGPAREEQDGYYAAEHSESGSEYEEEDEYESDDSTVSVNVTVNIDNADGGVDVDADVSAEAENESSDDGFAYHSGKGKSHKKGYGHRGKKKKHHKGYGVSKGSNHMSACDYERPIRDATQDVLDLLDEGTHEIVDDFNEVIDDTLRALGGRGKARGGKARVKPAATARAPSAPSNPLGTKRGQVLHYDMDHTLDVPHSWSLKLSPGEASKKVPTSIIGAGQIAHAVKHAALASDEKKPFGLHEDAHLDRLRLAEIACGKLQAHLVDPRTGLKVAEVPYDVGVRYKSFKAAEGKATGVETHLNQHVHYSDPGMGLLGHSGTSLNDTHVNSLAPFLKTPMMYNDHYNAGDSFNKALKDVSTFSRNGKDFKYGNLDRSSAFYRAVSGEGKNQDGKWTKIGKGKKVYHDWVKKQKDDNSFHRDEEFVHNFPYEVGQKLCKEMQTTYNNKSICHSMEAGGPIKLEFHPRARTPAKDSKTPEACTWESGIHSSLIKQGALLHITGSAKATFAIAQPATAHELSCDVIAQ